MPWHTHTQRGSGVRAPIGDKFLRTKVIAKYYTKACKFTSVFLLYRIVKKVLCVFNAMKYVIFTPKCTKIRLGGEV